MELNNRQYEKDMNIKFHNDKIIQDEDQVATEKHYKKQILKVNQQNLDDQIAERRMRHEMMKTQSKIP
jgi:hypothetical protein